MPSRVAQVWVSRLLAWGSAGLGWGGRSLTPQDEILGGLDMLLPHSCSPSCRAPQPHTPLCSAERKALNVPLSVGSKSRSYHACYAGTRHKACVEVRGQLCGVGSLLLPLQRFGVSNSGPHAFSAGTSPTKPPPQPHGSSFHLVGHVLISKHF